VSNSIKTASICTKMGEAKVYYTTNNEVVYLSLGKDDAFRSWSRRNLGEVQLLAGGEPDLPVMELREYFSGKRFDFQSSILLKGTPFQKQVWQACKKIPYGKTLSYGQLSQKIFGNGKGRARAVGQALGANPIPIIVPCHRVLTSKGGLGGFSAGLDWKRYLLNLESSKYSE
jgi:methylated-DNA-[protein]-cysteine S-methyltransferase